MIGSLSACLRSRYAPGNTRGFYESYFVRANAPFGPRAFWLRYTVFVPKHAPEAALGELWAIYFDGQREQHVAVYEAHPLSRCELPGDDFRIRIAGATLDASSAEGRAAQAAHGVAWSLRIGSGDAPLLLLPERLYATGFPKAKSLVAIPNARFEGQLVVDGENIDVSSWTGSLNHNWGVRHTDHYAWGQVAGFDGHPDSFLECATARLRVGPVHTPFMTTLVLRVDGHEYAVRGLVRALGSPGRFSHFDWRFESSRFGGDAGVRRGVRLRARFHANAERFVRLRYAKPEGGEKVCWNSKIACAELTLQRPNQPDLQLTSAERAAFEILEDGSGSASDVACQRVRGAQPPSRRTGWLSLCRSGAQLAGHRNARAGDEAVPRYQPGSSPQAVTLDTRGISSPSNATASFAVSCPSGTR